MISEAGQPPKVSKDEYKAALPDLRVALINAQFDIRRADFPVVIVVMGDDRHAMDDAVETLHEWMDARYLQAEVFYHPTEEESERPRMWGPLTKPPPTR